MSDLIPPAPGSIDDPPVRLATIRQRVASIDATERGLAYAYRDDGAFLLGQLDAVKAERDEARRDAAHLRKPHTVARRRDEVTDWAAEAIARAPLLVGLVATAKSPSRTAPAELFFVANDSPRGPLTLTQEGAVEVFLESGPAAMVALVAERDELRLEIAAMRGDKAGAVSDRWKWSAPCWRIRGADGALLAKVATTNLLAWTRNGDIETGGIEQATSIRDGMRQCEARLAGGAS